MGTDSNLEKLRAAEAQLSNRGGYENLSFADRLRLAGRELKQENEFGWTEEMVTDRSQEAAEKSKVDMGLQAMVEYDGTAYENAFDGAVAALRAFARSGTEQTGWRYPQDEVEHPGNLYGQLNTIDVNGRSYEVIEATRWDSPRPSVSIRAVSVRENEEAQWQQKNPEAGSYYFNGVAPQREGGVTGERKIELHGAHMSVEETMGDIAQIIHAAEAAQALKEQG